MMPPGRSVLVVSLGLCALTTACTLAIPDALQSYRIAADAIAAPLSSEPGDPARGRSLVIGRDGNCLLCHSIPDGDARLMGELGPPLSGVGSRLSAAQLRLRIVDSMRLNPQTIMPSYYRTHGLNEVGQAWRGRPIFNAQQVEDVVAYLTQLR